MMFEESQRKDGLEDVSALNEIAGVRIAEGSHMDCLTEGSPVDVVYYCLDRNIESIDAHSRLLVCCNTTYVQSRKNILNIYIRYQGEDENNFRKGV